MVGFTNLWLVSAEKVDDWNSGAAGLGIPKTWSEIQINGL
jgi:hypothetical protein